MLQTQCKGAFSKKLLLDRTFGFQWQISRIKDVVGLRFVGDLEAFSDLIDRARQTLCITAAKTIGQHFGREHVLVQRHFQANKFLPVVRDIVALWAQSGRASSMW